jgi:gliding motility-associated-like protein
MTAGDNATTFTWTASSTTGTVSGFTASGTSTGTTLTGEALSNTGTADAVVTYVLTPRIANGANFCSGTADNVAVTVKPIPTAPTTLDLEYCVDETVSSALTATGTGTLKWYDDNDPASIALASAPTPTTTATTDSRSWWVSQTVNGCESPRSELEVTVNALPTITEGNKDCSSDLNSWLVEITVSDATKESITITSGSGTVGAAVGNTYPITDIDKGTDLEITVTNSDTGCSEDFTIDSAVCACDATNTPGSPIAGSNNTPAVAGEYEYCNGVALTLSASKATADAANNDIILEWYDAVSSGTLLSPVGGSTSYVPATFGTAGNTGTSFWVEARNTVNGCISSRVEVELVELPVFTSGSIEITGQIICEDEFPTTLTTIGSTTAASGGDGDIEYQWLVDGTPISSSNSAIYTPSETSPGTYTYTRQAKDGKCNTDFTNTTAPSNISTGSWVLTIDVNPTIDGVDAISPGGTVNLTVADSNEDPMPTCPTANCWSVDATSAAAGVTVSNTGAVYLPNATLTSGATITVTYSNGSCSTTHTLTVSSVGSVTPYGNLHFCVGDDPAAITPVGDANVEGWMFYIKDVDPVPTVIVPGHPDLDLPTLAATDHDVVYMVIPYNGSELGIPSEFLKLVQNADYSFTVTNPNNDESSIVTPFIACKDELVSLTAKKASGITAGGESYAWDWDGTTGTVAGSYPLPTGTATTGSSLVVRGEITPASIDYLTAHVRYCPVDVTVYYAVSELAVVKDNWATTLCKNDITTLDLDDTGTILPTGTSLKTRWYTGASAAATTTHDASANDKLSYTINNIQETTYYRVEVDIVDGSDNVICTIADIDGVITVPEFSLSFSSNSTNTSTPPAHSYCDGDAMTLTSGLKAGHNLTAVEVSSIVWTWELNGTPTTVGVTDNVLSKTYDETTDAGIYKITATLGTCTSDTTISVITNASVAFSVPATTVYACIDQPLLITPSPTTPSSGISYSWVQTHGGTPSGAISGNSFDVTTSSAGTGTIAVTGTASNYCATTETINYDVLDLSLIGAPNDVTENLSSLCGPATNGAVLDPSSPISTIIRVDVGGSSTLPSGSTITWTYSTNNGINWTALASGDASGRWVSVSPSVDTQYKATLNVSSGGATPLCTPEFTHSISMVDLGMGKISDKHICEQASFSSQGNFTTASSWWWEDSSNTLVSGTTNSPMCSISVPVPSPGDTFYFVGQEGGCIARKQVNVTSDPKVEFTLPTAIELCKGDEYAILPTGVSPLGTNFTWTVNGITSTSSSFSVPTENATLLPTTISVVGQSGLCSTYGSVQFTVVGLEINVDWLEAYCQGDELNITSTITETPMRPLTQPTWSWNTGESGSGYFANIENPNPSGDIYYRKDAQTTVNTSAFPSNGVCKAYSESTIKEISVDLGTDQSICPGDKVTITADTRNVSTIDWFKQGHSMTQTGRTIVEYPIEDTRYSVNVSQGGITCYDADAINIRIVSAPEILNILIPDDDSKTVRFIVDGGSTPYEYSIDYPNSYRYSDISDRLQIGIHTVYVRDNNGCITSGTFEISEPVLEFPPYFSPDGDGNNDTWKIKGIEAYDKIDLVIYDRFGKELVNITNPLESWDGIYLNNLLPSTDYWYVLHIPETNKRYVGHFTLIR